MDRASCKQMLHPYLHRAEPLIFAHQGDSAYAPGNSMPAFEQAVHKGCDVLETDIHWTRDGVIVISHDDTVDRMSNGSGRIRDMYFSELRELDFGFRYTQDGGATFPFRGRGVHILTLQEALEAFPDQLFNVDIKPRNPASLVNLIRLIFELEAVRRICLASFHDVTLRAVRSRTTEIAISASPCDVFDSLWKPWFHRPLAQNLPFIAFQVPERMYGVPIATRRFIDSAHKASRKVHVWTINEEHTMSQLLRLGVDGIVTDDVQQAVSIRQKYLQSD